MLEIAIQSIFLVNQDQDSKTVTVVIEVHMEVHCMNFSLTNYTYSTSWYECSYKADI